MLHYDYGYKHYKLKIDEQEIFIELSIDNFMNQETYSAKTNYLFFDNNERSWGHACGVGANEENAINMCLQEVKCYTGIELPIPEEDISIPQRITIENKNNIDVFYNLKENESNKLLTSHGVDIISLESKDILTFVLENINKYKGCGVELEKVDKNIQFKNIFETLTKKYCGIPNNEKDKD